MRISALAGLIAFTVRLAIGQPAVTARPAFEVASIKPSKSQDQRFMIRPLPGGRLNVTNVPLKQLITVAYRVQDFQISGGPDWLNSERFDIAAKAEEDANFDQLRLMLRSLLEDRFQLKLRRETKEAPIYALVMANKRGKYGPNLQESSGDCPPRDGGAPPPRPPSAPGQMPTPVCGGMFGGLGRLAGSKISLAQLTDILSRSVGRPVVDKTGLTGKFDIKLEWTPDQVQFSPGSPDPARPAPPPDAGPTIFTAIQEQLGLKLAAEKGPVEVLIVDHAEQPDEN